MNLYSLLLKALKPTPSENYRRRRSTRTSCRISQRITKRKFQLFYHDFIFIFLFTSVSPLTQKTLSDVVYLSYLPIEKCLQNGASFICMLRSSSCPGSRRTNSLNKCCRVFTRTLHVHQSWSSCSGTDNHYQTNAFHFQCSQSFQGLFFIYASSGPAVYEYNK